MTMKFSLRHSILGGLLLCGSSLLPAHTAGTAIGYSGAPDENSCSACHGRSQAANTGGGRITVLAVNASGYTPGRPLRLRITLEDPFGARWGFQMTTRRGTGTSSPIGGFTALPDQGTVVAPGEASPTYINQSSAGTRPNTPNRVSWEVDWNAPSTMSGTVIFHVAGVAGNGDGGADMADNVYTGVLSVQQGAEAVQASRVLPQFVFGQGFISTLAFANTRETSATVRVNFYTPEGAALPVNGNASRLLTLAPKGSAFIRADDTGPTTQGWALIDLPDGVIGHGVFRQRVPGRIDQEAVVMLSRTDSKLERIVYDQTAGLDTALVLLNTSNIDALVVVRIRDENGALLATLNRTLQPRQRTTIDFRTEPVLGIVQGKRGLAEFEVGGASVAVLALRFDDAGAFTSVPNGEK